MLAVRQTTLDEKRPSRNLEDVVGRDGMSSAYFGAGDIQGSRSTARQLAALNHHVTANTILLLLGFYAVTHYLATMRFLCRLKAELGFLSVGINSSVFTSFVLAVFSQYYLRKSVILNLGCLRC